MSWFPSTTQYGSQNGESGYSITKPATKQWKLATSAGGTRPLVSNPMFFDANGAIDRPADFTPQASTVYGMGRYRGAQFAPEIAQQIREEHPMWSSAMWGGGTRYNHPIQNPYGGLHPDQQPFQATGTAPAGTAPVSQAGAPQGIGANALMTAPQQWGERRDPVMPLQGYQNALLRGF